MLPLIAAAVGRVAAAGAARMGAGSVGQTVANSAGRMAAFNMGRDNSSPSAPKPVPSRESNYQSTYIDTGR